MSTSTDLAVKTITDDQLSRITSYNDAAALLAELGIAVEKASDYGTGFSVEKNKDKLVGVDFIILSWAFHTGDYNDQETGEKGEFVAAEIVTKHGEKLVIIDGGTGVYAQLKTVTAQRLDKGHKHPQAGLHVEDGLTKSSYFRDKAGNISKTQLAGYEPGTTYYLSA